jgi:hypothetical protein
VIGNGKVTAVVQSSQPVPSILVEPGTIGCPVCVEIT